MGVGRRRVLALVGAASLVAMGVVGAFGTALASADDAKPDLATLPKSLHGAVETKAFTVGTTLPPLVPFVGSVLFDPGPAYAYSTLDRDDYGEGNVNYTMTARGANLDPGTIAAAAMWAPPDCAANVVPCFLRNPTDPIANGKRPAGGAPQQGDIGLNNAAGFPGYAEALYPDQPGQPSQQTVYKCVVNKDANGSAPTGGQAQTICQQGGDSVPVTAWATAVRDQVKSEGFSRGLGFGSPGMFSVGTSESHSLVKPEAGGVLHATGYSTINSIDIGGQIHIDQVRSEADIKATSDKLLSATGSCTMSGLTVGGQAVQQTTGGELPAQQLQPLLDGVQQATQLQVHIDPPTGVENITVEGSKHVVDCAGLHISLTDLRADTGVCSPAPPPPPPPGSGLPPVPQCVPPLGTRYELSFGRIAVQESVNAFPAGAFDTGGATTSVEGVDLSAPPVTPDLGASPSTETPSVAAPYAPTGGTGTFRSGPATNAASGPGFKFLKANLATIAAWTTAAAAGIALVVWLLFGVVNSISQGTRLRLPGL